MLRRKQGSPLFLFLTVRIESAPALVVLSPLNAPISPTAALALAIVLHLSPGHLFRGASYITRGFRNPTLLRPHDPRVPPLIRTRARRPMVSTFAV
jgi:hypothetical protein